MIESATCVTDAHEELLALVRLQKYGFGRPLHVHDADFFAVHSLEPQAIERRDAHTNRVGDETSEELFELVAPPLRSFRSCSNPNIAPSSSTPMTSVPPCEFKKPLLS